MPRNRRNTYAGGPFVFVGFWNSRAGKVSRTASGRKLQYWGQLVWAKDIFSYSCTVPGAGGRGRETTRSPEQCGRVTLATLAVTRPPCLLSSLHPPVWGTPPLEPEQRRHGSARWPGLEQATCRSRAGGGRIRYLTIKPTLKMKKMSLF